MNRAEPESSAKTNRSDISLFSNILDISSTWRSADDCDRETASSRLDVPRSFHKNFRVRNRIFHREKMAEGEEKLTGLAKYFNSQTMAGRANVTKATYIGIGVIALFFYVRSKSKKT